MKGIRKCIVLFIAFCLTFSTFLMIGGQGSYAASPKKTYVMTKMVFNDYVSENKDGFDLSRITYSCKYDKRGLLKSAVTTMDKGNIRTKTAYKYGKKNNLKSGKTRIFYKGNEINAVSSKKVTVNSRGLVTAIKSYENGKSSGRTRYKWNQKGKKTREQVYNAKGKLQQTIRYYYTSGGKLKEEKQYDPSGKLICRIEYKREGSKETQTEYDGNGLQTGKVVANYENGNVASMKEYDSAGKLIRKVRFTYKKIKTAKKKYVQGQQAVIMEMAL